MRFVYSSYPFCLRFTSEDLLQGFYCFVVFVTFLSFFFFFPRLRGSEELASFSCTSLPRVSHKLKDSTLKQRMFKKYLRNNHFSFQLVLHYCKFISGHMLNLAQSSGCLPRPTYHHFKHMHSFHCQFSSYSSCLLP